MNSPTSALAMSGIGLVSLAIGMGIGRFAFTPLLPMMQADGLATIADGGNLAFAHFLGYLLGAAATVRLPQLPGRMLPVSLLTIAVVTLGMGLTTSLPLWLAFRWLAGVCSAFTLMIVSNVVMKQLALAGAAGRQGWVFSGVGIGIILAGLGALALMAGGIGSAVGWQAFGSAALLGTAVVWWLMRRVPETAPAAARRDDAATRMPLVWPLVIAYGAAGMGYIIPATYLPVMAREIIHSPLVFGWSWPVFGLAAFLSTLVAGRLYALGTNRQVWAGCQLVLAAGLLLPVIADHIVAIMLAGICVGGTFVVITLVGIKEMHRIAPPADVQRHIAAITVSFATGQMVGPLFAAWVYQATGSFSAPLLITSVALAVTAVPLLVGAPKTEPLRA